MRTGATTIALRNRKTDILWRDGRGNVAAWFMNGSTVASVITVGNIPANWNLQGVNAD